jgi:hypothetical protein
MRALPFAFAVLVLLGCPKKESPRKCLDVMAESNSPSTTAVFEARDCQGGGVTWAALLNVVTRRHGKVSPVEGAPTGWTGEVQSLTSADDLALFSIDEEGDAARFCTNSPGLLEAMRREVALLNQDRAALLRAMSEAVPRDLECELVDGGPAK